MAYRRPAVSVIQEFLGLVPALASFTLPSVSTGKVFQLVSNDLLGTYAGNSQAYTYAGKTAGAFVDLEKLASDEQFPATKKPIAVLIKNAEVEVKTTSLVGVGANSAFSDVTSARFTGVQSGDFIVIEPVTGIAILAPVANGVSSDVVGQRNRLASGVPGQFADVKQGDIVDVTGGTNTEVGTYTVAIKVNNDLLVLDADVNDGGGPATDVAFSISGDRGQANEGAYKIKTVTDANNLVLESVLPEAESFISYYVKRAVASITLDRADDLVSNGFLATADDIQLPANLTYQTFPIIAGTVRADYRALRVDMSGSVREFARLTDLQAFFGVDQINPANELAYGLSIMLQNTTTPVNGLGLGELAATDEVQAYQAALDVLARTEMYAICPLTQNPVVGQLMKPHVEQLSLAQKERVAIVNRKLVTVETLKDESTTVTNLNNSRVIVNTQVDGVSTIAQATHLNDPTVDAFLTVQPGDTVSVVGGTNAIVTTATVQSKTDNNNLVLSTAIVTGNSTNIQYFIARKDGIGADGITFYDRNANFITDGIVAGHMFKILSGPYAGSYKIASVSSEKQLVLTQIPGIVSLTQAVNYEIYRDMTKSEQAQFVATYSSAIGSRRVVNVWPDLVKAPVGAVTQDLPGYYAGAAIAAITTGLPTQQGFTNLTIVGFLGLEHSTGYFDDNQLDTMAGGGTFIFGQEGEETPLFIRHQLTSDTSAIKFQEYSVTKNVDYISKFLRSAYKGFIGVYNIVETTLDELKNTAKACITFLKDTTRLPRIGGVIRSGQLTKLEESDTQIDTVIMRFLFNIPIPLNNLEITIEV